MRNTDNLYERRAFISKTLNMSDESAIISTINSCKENHQMTIEENIFLAKRNVVDSIYNSARLEGINTTFPQTDAIINGARAVD